MSIDAATVKRIAHLARIKLEDNEVPALEAELNMILDWVEQLGTVDTDGVEPLTSVEEMALRQREDEVTDGNYAGRVLANAPDAQFGFFAVPKVVE
ncbi:MAG: Asp-tRNA(Asn)/Glu-tRNA(Gln) amidotransferase subunit GatC [Sphingomonadales bacterium]